MVKKRVGGAHRYRAVQRATAAAAAAATGGGPLAAAAAGASKQQAPEGPRPPSHLQRKITKQVKFYERVLSTPAVQQSGGGVHKRSKKKGSAATLASLDSLAAELDGVVAAAAASGSGSGSSSKQQARGTKSSIKRSRARLAVGVSETQRLQRVLAHPAYQADPIAAITNHLRSTLPGDPLPSATAAQRSSSRGGGGAAASKLQRKKTKRAAAGGGVQAMQS